MKFENTETWGFKHAIRGMRNPLESWDKSDSTFYENGTPLYVGERDLCLMKKLVINGTEHRKFMRQIFVSVDITAPMYFFSEFDTYKVGTVANSTSKMHKLASTPITMDCFEMGDFNDLDTEEGAMALKECQWETLINWLEDLRNTYNETKDKRYWKELIRILPESWLQTRTVTMNYENLLSMYKQRKNHKLTEWHTFCDWIKTLPLAKELIIDGE